jgi:hypothetical protein
MKVLINTKARTIKLEESVPFRKLHEFVLRHNIEDYTILLETITVTEKEWYPVYLYWPQPWYPVEPYVPDPQRYTPRITTGGSDLTSNIHGVISVHPQSGKTVFVTEV